MFDPVERYRLAAEAGDVNAMIDLIAPDGELVSPLSGRLVFRGRQDLRVLFDAIYSTARDVRWTGQVGDGSTRVLLGTARVGPLKLTDAMVLGLTEDGQIGRLRPHLRPWLAVTAFAAVIGPKMARSPQVLRRALAAGNGSPLT